MNDIKGIIEDCNKSDLVSDKVIKKIIEIIGQEKWNDIHDEESDICTTTGELIITLKGIPYLEKENAELKEKLGDVQMQKAGEKSDLVWKLITRLDEAKEIIKDYMIVATSGHITVCSVPEENRCINVLKLNEQAKQFLKETEE